jgi:hypothetical protein
MTFHPRPVVGAAGQAANGPRPPLPSCPRAHPRSRSFPGLLRPVPSWTRRARSRPGTLFIVSLGRLGFAPSLCLLHPYSPSSSFGDGAGNGGGVPSSRSPPGVVVVT